MASNPTKLAIAINVSGIPELTKLKAALKSTSAGSKSLGAQFSRTAIELKELEKSIKPSINSTRALRDSFRELGNQVEFGGRKFKFAQREAERLDKQLQKMEKRQAPRFGGFRGAAQTVGTIAGAGVFGGPEGAIGAGLGAILGGGPQGAIVGGAIGAQVGSIRQAAGAAAEYSANLQKLRIALVGVTTSNAEYATALDAITQATQDYALPQDIVTRQFTKLQASVQGAGGDIEDTKDAFDGIVAAVRATGGSLADVDAALTATAQVFSKGKVSAEELRQQIGERLPGAFTLFAESMNLTPQELDKALEKGQVSLQDFMVFVRKITERYKENAKAIADSPAAAGDRLKRDLGLLSESVGKLLEPIGAAFQNTFGAIVRSITAATNALADFLGIGLENAVKVAQRNYDRIQRQLTKARAGGGRGGKDTLQRQLNIARIELQEAQAALRGDSVIVRPEETKGLAGIDVDGTGAAGAAAKDISFALREAQIAALRETNDERRLALEFEAKLIQIQESGLEPNKRAVQLAGALKTLSEGRAKIEEKRANDIKRFYDSFKVKGGMFDMNAQAEQKTPFDMLRQGADDFTDSLKGALKASQELAQVGLQGISDGITELVVNGTVNFREFAASLLRDMARIIMQQVVMKSLMQALGFGGGLDLGSFFAKSTPSFNMNQATGGLAGFGMPKMMAKGGITRGVSIAGEAGPEAVVPLPDGRSIPVTMQGEGTKVVVNVDAQGTAVQGDSGRAGELGQALGAAIRQELLKQKRPGGLLA